MVGIDFVLVGVDFEGDKCVRNFVSRKKAGIAVVGWRNVVGMYVSTFDGQGNSRRSETQRYMLGCLLQ